MSRLTAIGICSLLALGMVCFTSCGSAEWAKDYIPGNGYSVHFEMPKPFTKAAGTVRLMDGRTPFEHGYVTQGDDEHKFQVRVIEMPVAAWQAAGYNRSAVVEYALSRENPASADKILDRHDFNDPVWPDHVNPAEELTIESADGKTVRHSRVVLYEGRETVWCYVLLTASRPKDEPRSPDVDKFFNSLKICTGDERPGRC